MEIRMTEQEIIDQFPEVRGQRLIRAAGEMPVLEVNLREGIPVLQFPKLRACPGIAHCFTLRAGGVSEGHSATMNFSRSLGDTREHVQENFRRIADVLGCKPMDMVTTRQTHSTNIRRVQREDGGQGVVLPLDQEDEGVDGLVTNAPGLALCAFGADCCTLYFADPVKKAIGLAHAGWRGTVCNMAGKMVQRMTEEFGTDPGDLLVAIGPSICQSCYEVDEKVAEAFRTAIGDDEEERSRIRSAAREGGRERHILSPGKAPGKYQLDLWYANLVFLCRAGVAPEQVEVTDLCTNHNPGLLFSHRYTRGKRGNMGAFLRLL